MFCTNCGKQIAETDKFCCGCGAVVETLPPPVTEAESEPEICTPEAQCAEPCCQSEAPNTTEAYPAYDFGASTDQAPEIAEETPAEPEFEHFAPPVVKQKNGIRVVLGALLILFAAAPYVLPYFINFNTDAIITALMYSEDHYSIVSAFQSVMGMAEPLFYFTASIACLVAGCSLVMKHRGSAKLLKAAVVINIIAIGFGVLSAAVLYFFPDMLVMAMGGGSSYAELAVLMMSELPQILLYLMNSAIFHVAMAVLAVVFGLLISKNSEVAWQSTDLYVKDRSGAILVIPYVMALAKLVVMLVERYILMYQNSLYLSIATIAQTLLGSYFQVYILAFVVLAVVFAVLCRNGGSLAISILWTVLVAAAAAVVITGGYDLVVAYLRNYGVGSEYYSIVTNAFIGYAGVAAVWLIGLGIWMIASARGVFPVWVQIILGIVSLAAYGALEFVKSAMGLAFYVQLGSVGVLVILVAASIIGIGIAKRRSANVAVAELEEVVFDAPVAEENLGGEETDF